MGDKTSIEWTEATWNPVTGCTRVSEGCRHCYIERTMPFRSKGRKFVNGTTGVELHPERLDAPLRRKRPTKYFVNSLSDLFHEDVPTDFIHSVVGNMVTARRHTFQVLTKRPQRMLEYLTHYEKHDVRVAEFMPNVWWGVSVEDQKTADERIPLLLQTPAAVRFISAEPLLGPIDVKPWLMQLPTSGPGWTLSGGTALEIADRILDWVIVGGESGPYARSMYPDWARSLRDQCQMAGVPFFFKQWGEWEWSIGEIAKASRVGKKAAGRLLDGKEWNEFPG